MLHEQFSGVTDHLAGMPDDEHILLAVRQWIVVSSQRNKKNIKIIDKVLGCLLLLLSLVWDHDRPCISC
jgi:hypothetical protein